MEEKRLAQFRPRAYKSVATAPPLMKQLYAIMQDEQAAAGTVAARSGVAVHTILNWFRKHDAYLGNFRAVVNTLGWDIKLVRIEDGVQFEVWERMQKMAAAQAEKMRKERIKREQRERMKHAQAVRSAQRRAAREARNAEAAATKA